MNNQQRLISEIERDYDPDNDVTDPFVSYTEYQLLQLVKDLNERIEKLEAAQAESVASTRRISWQLPE